MEPGLTTELTRLVGLAQRDCGAVPPPVEAARIGHPDHRLVVYGTLRPGEPNHHLVAPLGSWRPVMVRGCVGDWCGYPILRWDPDGPPVPAALVTTERLPTAIAGLDRFEGPAYRRRLVVAETDTGPVLAQCYVDADADIPGGA